MKKTLIISLLLMSVSSIVFSQKRFDWNDSIFKIGETREVQILRAFDGPCTARPCYEYQNNNLIYDTIVTFLNKNKGISIALIWHTSTAGNDRYNFHISKKMAEGLIEELAKLGVSKKRITAIGLGESQPKIRQEDILKIVDRNKMFQTDLTNKRIEIIITTAPNTIYNK